MYCISSATDAINYMTTIFLIQFFFNTCLDTIGKILIKLVLHTRTTITSRRPIGSIALNVINVLQCNKLVPLIITSYILHNIEFATIIFPSNVCHTRQMNLMPGHQCPQWIGASLMVRCVVANDWRLKPNLSIIMCTRRRDNLNTALIAVN